MGVISSVVVRKGLGIRRSRRRRGSMSMKIKSEMSFPDVQLHI
jgi:hypothetical protein